MPSILGRFTTFTGHRPDLWGRLQWRYQQARRVLWVRARRASFTGKKPITYMSLGRSIGLYIVTVHVSMQRVSVLIDIAN